MFNGTRLKLRSYKEEPFSFLEVIDCRYKEHRYMLTVIERDDRVLHYGIELDEDIFEIIDKVEQEKDVLTVIVTDYEKHKHYYKVLERVCRWLYYTTELLIIFQGF